MGVIVLLVTSLLVGFLPVQRKSSEPPPIVSEGAASASFRDGVLRIRKSAG
jgi:hypothetical protein